MYIYIERESFSGILCTQILHCIFMHHVQHIYSCSHQIIFILLTEKIYMHATYTYICIYIYMHIDTLKIRRNIADDLEFHCEHCNETG